jgi:hypothetical protein
VKSYFETLKVSVMIQVKYSRSGSIIAGLLTVHSTSARWDYVRQDVYEPSVEGACDVSTMRGFGLIEATWDFETFEEAVEFVNRHVVQREEIDLKKEIARMAFNVHPVDRSARWAWRKKANDKKNDMAADIVTYGRDWRKFTIAKLIRKES